MQKNKPTITYKTITINKRNIKAYRTGRARMFRGEFYSDKNTIVIFRYNIDKKLGLSNNDKVIKQIQANTKLEKETLAHEIKHFQNAQFGNQDFLVTSYYEICGLKAFDEVSAFAAEYLTSTKHPTHTDVCYAVAQGIQDVMNTKSTYIPRFMREIQDLLHFKTYGADNDTIIEHIEKQIVPPKRHTKTFNTTVNNYLTFNGQGIRGPFNKIPTELKQRIKELQQTYESATEKNLRTKLNKLQNMI